MTKPYPRYYAINDRPVKVDQLPTGEVSVLVFDFTTGELVRDESYSSRVFSRGSGEEVDNLTEAQFGRLVAEVRQSLSEERQATAIVWEHTGDGEFPYRAHVVGKSFTIRVNDFPEEPLYTLLIEGRAVEVLEDWPSAWVSWM